MGIECQAQAKGKRKSSGARQSVAGLRYRTLGSVAELGEQGESG